MKDSVRRWVEALRSGKYKQAVGALHRVGKGYCCLGVACEVFAEDHKLQRGRVVDLELYDDVGCTLPIRVQRWLGLRTDEGAYDYGHLAGQNDGGMAFEQIAAIIESAPPGLFVSENTEAGKV